ncbi:hypothetical protein GOP47_0002963 [Adiantum capillus-veneris]|uniref:60S ribosomal protein L23 n=1 Tax=Adiantum capillus-veneris TaxID=13818 RepID=A0A9D4VB32_ADICA|nr:hypothetical protein GOP47_0002963 [Adiantum capillus-veneris]
MTMSKQGHGGWSGISNVDVSSCTSKCKLCRQQKSQESVCHLRQERQGQPQQAAYCLCWRHGVATVKKGKLDLRKKLMHAIMVRQKKSWRRKNGVFMYNAGVIVNPKGELKGYAITGPIGKECGDLWPRIASVANEIV